VFVSDRLTIYKVINSVVCCDNCCRLLSVNASNTSACSTCYGFDFTRIVYLPVHTYLADQKPEKRFFVHEAAGIF